jgi:hypothetical protein
VGSGVAVTVVVTIAVAGLVARLGASASLGVVARHGCFGCGSMLVQVFEDGMWNKILYSDVEEHIYISL